MNGKSLLLAATALLLLTLFACNRSPGSERMSLMTAVKTDDTVAALKLIQDGADANVRDSPSGWSALHYASRNGNVEIVKALINRGADPEYAGTNEGQTGTVISVTPIALAQTSLVLTGIPNVEKVMHFDGVDGKALMNSLRDPGAKIRYQKVIEILESSRKR